jgi:hypothetical protein
VCKVLLNILVKRHLAMIIDAEVVMAEAIYNAMILEAVVVIMQSKLVKSVMELTDWLAISILLVIVVVSVFVLLVHNLYLVCRFVAQIIPFGMVQAVRPNVIQLPDIAVLVQINPPCEENELTPTV